METSGWQFPGQPRRSRAAFESELIVGGRVEERTEVRGIARLILIAIHPPKQ